MPGTEPGDRFVAVLDDASVLVVSDGLHLIDPEEGSGKRVRFARPSTESPAVDPFHGPFVVRTPSGARVFIVGLWHAYRLARLDGSVMRVTAIAGSRARVQLVGFLDEDRAILHTRRQLLQLRFGSDEVEVLWPHD